MTKRHVLNILNIQTRSRPHRKTQVRTTVFQLLTHLCMPDNVKTVQWTAVGMIISKPPSKSINVHPWLSVSKDNLSAPSGKLMSENDKSQSTVPAHGLSRTGAITNFQWACRKLGQALTNSITNFLRSPTFFLPNVYIQGQRNRLTVGLSLSRQGLVLLEKIEWNWRINIFWPTFGKFK